MSARTMVPVELVGGPYDGHVDEVELNDPGRDVYLFECDGRSCAYEWRGTSDESGQRWLLFFMLMVGRRAAR